MKDSERWRIVRGRGLCRWEVEDSERWRTVRGGG